MIRISDLFFSRGDDSILHGVSFEIRRGEILGFLGPNGAGKSTTIQMIASLLQPTSGSITYDLADDQPPREKLARADFARLGYLPEHPPNYPLITVAEHLEFYAKANSVPKADVPSRVEAMLETFDLLDWRNKPAGELSKGGKQRLGLGYTFIHQPEFVLLDEPFSGLDPHQRERLRSFLQSYKRDRMLFLCSHSLPELEGLADRVIVIQNGRITLEYDPKDAFSTTLRLRFRYPEKAAEALSTFSQVQTVEAEDDGWFLVEVTGTIDAQEQVVKMCVETGLGLLECRVLTPVDIARRLFLQGSHAVTP